MVNMKLENHTIPAGILRPTRYFILNGITVKGKFLKAVNFITIA